MRREAGSATVALLAVVALALLLATGLAATARLLAAKAQADAAADAAALAAAPVTFRPFGARGTPAAEAARFAAANGARLVECRCPLDRTWRARTVVVVVVRPVRLPVVGSVAVGARAAAEFRPADLLVQDSTRRRRQRQHAELREPRPDRRRAGGAARHGRRSRRRGGPR